MNDVIEALQERDVYRWAYRDPKTNSAPWGDYHCCSRIAVVRSGRLYDTYWVGGDNRSFGLDDLPRLELKRLGNLSEWEVHMEYDADYYDDADIVDLNHSNSPRGNFYIRKGATRSKAKILETARARLEQALSDERTAARRSDELRAIISGIETGELPSYIPSWRS